MKKRLTKLWRWVGPLSGIGGLALLINIVDAQAVAAALTGANLFLLLPAASLVLLTTAVRAWRWAFLFRQRKVKIPFRRLLSANLMGSFYGQFLPISSGIGATLLFAENARCGGGTADFFATVLVERVLNLISLFGVASFVLLVEPPVGLPAASTFTIHLAFIGLIAGLFCLRRGWGIGWVAVLLSRLQLQGLSQQVGTLSQALRSDLGQAGVIGRGIALSILVNACSVMASYLVTLAVAGPMSLLSFLAPATLIATLQGVPITPGSLGVRESLYVFLLGFLGVSEPRALTVGLLVTMLHWLQGVIGGLVLLQRCLPVAEVSGALSRIRSALLPEPGRMFGRAPMTAPVAVEHPPELGRGELTVNPVFYEIRAKARSEDNLGSQ